MRKITILAILLLLAVLTSCSISNRTDNSTSGALFKNNKTERYKDYNIMVLSGVEDGIFKDSVTYFKSDTKETVINNSEKSTIHVGVHEYDAYLSKIKYSDRATTEEYRSVNGDCVYKLYKNNSSFTVKAQNDTVIREFSHGVLSEETLLEQVKNYILYYLPDVTLDNYNLTCKTRIIVKNTESSWGDNKDFFYLPDNEANETVAYYSYDFRLFNQGIKTPDCISIRCDHNGNLQCIEYHNSGVDWNTVKIDLDSIHNAASNFFKEAIQSRYSLIDCTISSESFAFADPDILVTLQCELTLKDSSSELSVLCPLVIIP